MSDVYQWVRRLRGRQFSRNRHFAEHLSPELTRARAMLRYLRSVEADVLAAEHIVARNQGESTELELHFPAVRFRRVLTLSKEQFALLLEHESCARRLTGVRFVSHDAGSHVSHETPDRATNG